MSTGSGLLFFLTLLNISIMIVFYLVLRARFSTRKILAEIRSEVDKLVSDLGREADRDVALLESRIKNLRALMDEADRRILLGEKEEAKRQRTETVLNETLANQPLPQTPKPEPRTEPVKIYTRPVISRTEKQIEPVIPMRDKVIDMARKGISPEMIAHTLTVSLGEVELILDMNDSSL